MSAGHGQTAAVSDFVVRPDGTVVGSDGAAGALAAALPYTGRLARRMESSQASATCAAWRRWGVDASTSP